MQLTLDHSCHKVEATLTITGSKSETNRLLLLQSLYPELSIENASNSDDSVAMQKALNAKDPVKDIHHAGTAMRFLTAYYAAKEGEEIILTGSARMQERPISLLVDALRSLGADITYGNIEGYPPLKIRGKKLEGGSCLLYTSPSPRDLSTSRMPSSA